ncbi:ASCH domain-containing protein [Candidatus Woesearchaeota archaeon]|nr:ASCH domain-containing protein [Candidatus Woesearchaeota archaeon]
MDHEMNLFLEPFERIKSGKKVIEVRLYDEKRRKIKMGDRVIFRRLPDDIQEKIVVEVIGLSLFRSFKELYAIFDKSKFGHPLDYTLEDQMNGIRKIYSEEKELEWGVVGIHLRLLV